MSIDTVQALITSVGFPIVCVIAMGYFIYVLFGKMTADSKEREEKLYEVIGKAQQQNETLSRVNAEFVLVLSTYKSDLEEIKDNIAEIKEKF